MNIIVARTFLVFQIEITIKVGNPKIVGKVASMKKGTSWGEGTPPFFFKS